MRKIILLISSTSMIFCLEMPPSPPIIEKTSAPKPSIEKIVIQKKDVTKECLMVPKGLYLLPPPLQKDLKKCQNSFFMPSVKEARTALKKLFNKKYNIKKIKSIEGFNQLYEIQTQAQNYVCNQMITRCFKKSKLYIKE